MVVENCHLSRLALLGSARGVSHVVKDVPDFLEYPTDDFREKYPLLGRYGPAIGNDNRAAAIIRLYPFAPFRDNGHGFSPTRWVHVCQVVG